MRDYSEWNPKFVAYAHENGREPEEQIAHDEATYPGACMTGFIIWCPGYNRRQASA